MQVADAVLRPPRDGENCLVRPRMHGQITRIITRRRRQRDADEQVREPSERAAAKLPKENPGCFFSLFGSAMQSTRRDGYPSNQGLVAVVASH